MEFISEEVGKAFTSGDSGLMVDLSSQMFDLGIELF